MATILVIDDDGAIRGLIRCALEKAGHDVAEAADGELGLYAYRRQPVDLVLCDLVMPKREGLETIRGLRAWDPGVPIVAMSEGSSTSPMNFLPVAAKMGASATLAKPITIQAMLGLVAGLLDRAEGVKLGRAEDREKIAQWLDVSPDEVREVEDEGYDRRWPPLDE